MAGIMASAVLAGCTNEPAPSSTSQAEAGKDSAYCDCICVFCKGRCFERCTECKF